MSQSFIYVKPSADPSRVKVLTELLEELEIPVYIGAHADGTLIDEDNPSPISLDAKALTDLMCKLNEVVVQLKISNAYNALGHDEAIKEEDVNED